jgi:hypothetical protein
MAFTDRYIKLPIKIFDIKEKDLTDKENLIDSWWKLNPYRIESYRPSEQPSADERSYTVIVTDSGDSTTVYLTIDEFEALLNKFAFTN